MLACTFGSCHVQCRDARDCPIGSRCIANAGGGVCTLSNENHCDTSVCPSPLVCVGDRCQTMCQSNTDCLAGVCTNGTCNEPVSTGGIDAGRNDAASIDAAHADAATPIDAHANDAAAIDAFAPHDAGLPVDPTIPAPRQITPMSGSVATSSRPGFQWDPTGVSGAAVQLCRDRACSMVVGEWVLNGGSGQIGAPLTPGLYFWRLRGLRGGSIGSSYGSVWQLRIYNTSDVGTGTRWGAELDIRGDGLADVAIGRNIAGSFTTYLGSSPGGLGMQVGMSSNPVVGSGRYAYSLAAAGDVNGDGFGDLIVGNCGPSAASTAPDATTCANQVYVFHGSATGANLATTINSPMGGMPGFGISVASAGDVNADGYGDVVVGAYWADVAYVYLGSHTGVSMTPHATLAAGGTGHLFGVSVASIGDYDGDNDADIVVGAPQAWNTVYVFCGNVAGLGATPTPCGTITGPSGSNLGLSVAPAGDINGDGWPDLIAGGNGGNGVVQTFLGHFGAIVTTVQDNLVGTAAGTGYGVTVTGIGDANADGYCDLAWRSGVSTVTIAYARTGGMQTVITRPEANFGRFVAGIGDVNGDARGDLLVSACNTALDGSNCDNAVFAFYGGSPVSTTPSWTQTMASGGFGLGAMR
jgi:hypothetical protein